MNQTSEAPADKEVTTTTKTGWILKNKLMLSLGIHLIVTVLSIYAYDRFFAQKIAVFDRNKYINQVKEEYIKGNITNEDLVEVPKRVKTTIDSVSKNTTVLIGEAVLKNGKYIEVPN